MEQSVTENAHDITRLPGNRPAPFAKATVFVHCLDPLIQKRALGFVLVGVLALGFKNQKASCLKAHSEIGPVFVHYPLEDIEYFESKMIVLCPRIDILIAIQLEGFRRFPGAVKDTNYV